MFATILFPSPCLARGRVRLAAPARGVFGWIVHAALVLVLLLATQFALAQDVLPVPALGARVVDQTGTLDASQVAALDAQLAALETRKGSQVVVLMVPTTRPEDIASYANRVANEWKIGRREIGDGVLLIVAKEDRQLRIEVAKTLEGAIPDLAAKRIIDGAITPAFKQGDFAGGVQAGVAQIAALISGEALPEPEKSTRGPSFQLNDVEGLLVFLVFALPIGASILRSVLGRKLGALGTGAGVGVLAFLFSTSLWIAGLAAVIALAYGLFGGLALPGSGMGHRGGSGRFGGHGGFGGGGFGGGGGGGGFGSGGGGDFGGGGASGNW